VAFGLVVVVFGAYWGARASSVFAVRTVEVRGAPPDVARQIQRVTKSAVGTSLLSVDASTIEGRVRSLPSIAAASVDRGFPHTLVIRVAPVRPVGVAQRGKSAWIVSGSNRVIRAIDPTAERGLPRVWLPHKVEVEVGGPLPTAYEPVTRTLAAIRDAHVGGRVKGVKVANGELVVVMETGVEVLLGDPTDLAVKLAVARQVLPLVDSGMRYLDVSVPDRPVASVDLNSQVESEGSPLDLP
jgi:cell division protein FtsQ